VSRKTIAFSMPAKPAAAREAEPPPLEVLARPDSDEWVRERDFVAAAPRADGPAGPPGARSVLLDLTAERSLTEVIALAAIAPIALYWFWLVNAMAGRVRF
jgi:hypothetical protein